MNVCLLDPSDPNWAAFLALVQHDFHHLPAYVSLEARRLGGEAVALLVAENGRQMLLPLIVRKIPGSTLDAVSPYGYPGPLTVGTDDSAFVGEALDEAAISLRRDGWVTMFVRTHPLLNLELPSGPGGVAYEGDTVAIDLSISADERWRSIRRQHRQKVVHAHDAGVTTWFDEGLTQFDTFRRLYEDTMRRVSAAPHYFFDDEYYDGLRSALGERLHLMIVDAHGDVAAAVLFVETAGIVEYHLMGTDPQLLRLTPAALAICAASEWAAARGDRWLMLGGGVGPANDSLLHFKSGFSPLVFPFRTMRIVIDDDEYQRLSAERGAEEPEGSENEFFPAYRRPVRS